MVGVGGGGGGGGGMSYGHSSYSKIQTITSVNTPYLPHHILSAMT